MESTRTSLMRSRHSGFTLIEVMIVVSIVGILASVMLPRLSFYFEPQSAILQRVIEEATDKALSGVPVRLQVKQEGTTRRGSIESEALQKKELPADSLSVFLGTADSQPVVLEWQPLKLKNTPEGRGWRFSPEVIYFYTDGSCTPAKISWKEDNIPESQSDEYILTVTGYCAKLEK